MRYADDRGNTAVQSAQFDGCRLRLDGLNWDIERCLVLERAGMGGTITATGTGEAAETHVQGTAAEVVTAFVSPYARHEGGCLLCPLAAAGESTSGEATSAHRKTHGKDAVTAVARPADGNGNSRREGGDGYRRE